MLVMKSANSICMQECQVMLQNKRFPQVYTNDTDYLIKVAF